MIIQEHWLLQNQLHKVTNCAKDFLGIDVSGVDASTRILPSRPSSGFAILWRRCLDVIIKPVEFSFMCNHLCDITINANSSIISVLCVYFTTDSGLAQADNTDLDVILTDISSVCAHVKPAGFLIRGNINCDFNRNIGFVNTVSEYMIDNNCIMFGMLIRLITLTFIPTRKAPLLLTIF